MTTIVGIDPSLTNTGIAILVAGQPALLRSIGHGTPNGKSYNHRSDRIVSQTRAVIAIIDQWAETTSHDYPQLAVIEGPAYAHANAYTHDSAGLFWGLYSTLKRKCDGIAVVAPATRAKWATGSGRAQKPDILATVRAWWPNTHIANHDQADAAILALMGAMHHGDPTPFQPKPRHHAGIETVKWPTTTP